MWRSISRATGRVRLTQRCRISPSCRYFVSDEPPEVVGVGEELAFFSPPEAGFESEDFSPEPSVFAAAGPFISDLLSFA